MARITFGINLPPVLPPRKLVLIVQLLEALGFDEVVMPDHLVFAERFGAPDVWSLLALAAYRTRRVRLGTCVADPHRQPPAVLAQRAATIDQISNGRFVLGLGAGETMNLEPFGIAADRPVSRLEETVRIVRHLLDGGPPLDFDGTFFRLRGAVLDLRPRQRRLPIALAAHGPRMLALTGASADCWWPSMVPPDMYPELRAAVDRASAAGREGAVEHGLWISLFLTDDEAYVRRVARRGAAAYMWNEVLARRGARQAKGPPAMSYWTLNPFDPDSVRRLREHVAALPDDYLLDNLAWGGVKRLRRLFGDWVDAGVRHFQITDFSPDQTASVVTLASDVIPYFSRRRATFVARAARTLLPLLPRDRDVTAAVRRYLDPQ